MLMAIELIGGVRTLEFLVPSQKLRQLGVVFSAYILKPSAESVH